MSNYSNFF